MKKIFYLSLLIIFINSCDIPQNNAEQKLTDTRPKKQLQLIKEFNDADSTYRSQTNDISKKEILDSAKSKISGFIINHLNSKFENWSAIVESIEVSELEGNPITLSLVIPLKNNFDIKLPEADAILLSSTINFDDKPIKDQLKALKPFDKVLISGTFEKDILNNIDIASSDLNDATTFNSPKVLIKIITIKK